MCSPGGVVPAALRPISRFQSRACCRTSKAIRQATQKERAHDAHAEPVLILEFESSPTVPGPSALLHRDWKLARTRFDLQAGRSTRGPHAGGAVHASGVTLLHPNPELVLTGPEQPEFPTGLIQRTASGLLPPADAQVAALVCFGPGAGHALPRGRCFRSHADA